MRAMNQYIAAMVLVALFNGCAVLTVDVDVYKGPLANHDDVQMQSVISMAHESRHLLVHLRDILEVNGDLTELPRLRGLSWYRDGYINVREGRPGAIDNPRYIDSVDTTSVEYMFHGSFKDTLRTFDAPWRLIPRLWPPWVHRHEGLSNNQAIQVNNVLRGY